ncbi:TadE family protein [Massilia sp. CF038]|uniref:TadE family protein n=1 Tax=Massilia sp. CF038 TaxID=1881045 RepID=UPI000916D386|nr:TadE family protein [Massilia sp. CF038]SHH40781.1 TadE-like protein [Massilia sp. CF038]
MRHFTPKSSPRSQFGVAAVEFALGSMLFFTFVFGVLELARALYAYSTMVEVTRRAARAAAFTDFSNAGALDGVRRVAMFGDIPGGMPLRGNLQEQHLAIDYLNGTLEQVSPMPACPEQNIINCNQDPEGASCIRFVRVRLCYQGSGPDCSRVEYVPIIGANFFPGAPLHFPSFATVTPVATLGYQPGVAGNCL